MAAEVHLQNVSKVYNKTTVVIPGIDLKLPKNELTVFVGPSGCGKSSLLKLIAGLEEVSGGEIFIDGKNVTHEPPSKRGIAMVFQSYALYPHMSVYENMAFALKISKTSPTEIDEKVRNVAQTLKLTKYLDRKPRQLSGGQRQRVAIGRALVRNPEVFLLDEPLSNLDAALRVDMRIEIAKIREHLNATMVYVTHDQVEAMTLADNIVVLRKGHIEQMGPPLEIYSKPLNKFVAGFLGSPSMNFIGFTVGDIIDNNCTLSGPGVVASAKFKIQPGSLKAGEHAFIGIRPEHIDVQKTLDGAELEFKTYAIEHLGDHSLLYGHVGESSCVLKVDPYTTYSVGETLGLKVQKQHYHVFDKDEKNVVDFARS